jgi:hypothetical protein
MLQILKYVAIIVVTCAAWSLIFPFVYSHLPESVSKHLGIVLSLGPNNAVGGVICITPDNDCKEIVAKQISTGKDNPSLLSLLRFWTPSPKTASSFIAYENGSGNPVDPPEEAWQKNIKSEALTKFALELQALDGVKGFRRFESFGKGRTFFKEGYWWEVTVTSNFKMDSFKAAYRTLCGDCSTTYVELAHADQGQYDSVLKSTASGSN